MGQYFNLVREDELKGLMPGDHVYICYQKAKSGKDRLIPAMILPPNQKDHITVTYLTQTAAAITDMAIATYEDDWFLMTKIFSVNTPDGDIIVRDKRDADYPGITVTMKNTASTKAEPEITLAMVEYLRGGELVDIKEFNGERQAELKNRTEDFNRTTKRITAGLTTHVFADDGHNDRSNITLHYGYRIHGVCVLTKENYHSARAYACGETAIHKTPATRAINFTTNSSNTLLAGIEHIFGTLTLGADTDSGTELKIVNELGETIGTWELPDDWSGETACLSRNGIEYDIEFKIV